MDTSALIVAALGVAGTLASGQLTHRTGLRTRAAELARLDAEQCANAARESHLERRASYAALNQVLRQFHGALFRHREALSAGRATARCVRDSAAARRALGDEYAQAQMVIPDGVLEVSGNLLHHLTRIHTLLLEHEPAEADPPSESLEEIADRLSRGSEQLYEVRQTMRRDLGISDAPVRRPDGYGTV